MPGEDFFRCRDAGLQGVDGRGEVGYIDGRTRELLIQSRRIF